jgi:hypothetical protein
VKHTNPEARHYAVFSSLMSLPLLGSLFLLHPLFRLNRALLLAWQAKLTPPQNYNFVYILTLWHQNWTPGVMYSRLEFKWGLHNKGCDRLSATLAIQHFVHHTVRHVHLTSGVKGLKMYSYLYIQLKSIVILSCYSFSWHWALYIWTIQYYRWICTEPSSDLIHTIICNIFCQRKQWFRNRYLERVVIKKHGICLLHKNFHPSFVVLKWSCNQHTLLYRTKLTAAYWMSFYVQANKK